MREDLSQSPSLSISLLNRFGQVPERSGLNWWNAGGRPRKLDEVYIPLPRHYAGEAAVVFGGTVVGTRFHAYLVSTDEWITLRLEGTVDRENRLAKQIASDGDKTRLGSWLLRDCLQLPARHVVTARDLLTYGNTSVTFVRQGTDSRTGWAKVEVRF